MSTCDVQDCANQSFTMWKGKRYCYSHFGALCLSAVFFTAGPATRETDEQEARR